MLIDCVVNDMLGEKTYIVSNDLKEALIIDPGSNYDDIYGYIMGNKLDVVGVLITHAHFDHIASCGKLQKLGYKIYVSELDAEKCSNADKCLANDCGVVIDMFVPDCLIINGQNLLKLGSFEVKIKHVPGHSAGGLAYIIGDDLFSGDTLFENGYGRYDFYDGDFNELMKSVKSLLLLVNQGYKLHCGH